MALNKFMHPRNIYKERADFKQLAIDFPEFREYANQDISGKVTIDFKNPDALRALTKALLRKDFSLTVEIPKNHLIPTLPSRLNYIHWLEDLLEAVPKSSPCDVTRGIDIGTGVACIYPLLGHTLNEWHFVATEADEESFVAARGNVAANQLEEVISVVKTNVEDSPLRTVVNSQPEDFGYAFCMCNPPFFSDERDANPKSRNLCGRTPPKSRNSANDAESITSGGEYDFVSKLIKDSIQLQTRVGIYTTLLGKKSSSSAIKGLLAEKGIRTVAATEFCQGKTMRWGIAWTFLPRVNLQIVPKTKKQSKNRPLAFEVPQLDDQTPNTVPGTMKRVKQLLMQLKMTVSRHSVNGNRGSFECSASAVTWAHQRRQRRALKTADKREDVSSDANVETTVSSTVEEKTNGHCSAQDEGQNTVLRCKICFKEMGEKILIEMNWLGGNLGRDAMHQVLQFLKNKFK